MKNQENSFSFEGTKYVPSNFKFTFMIRSKDFQSHDGALWRCAVLPCWGMWGYDDAKVAWG